MPHVNARPRINRRPHVCPHVNMRPHINRRPQVNAYAGAGTLRRKVLHHGGGGMPSPHIYAGGGDTQMQGLAPWGWGYTCMYLCKASCMQVVGTLGHKVLHHGDVGMPSPSICRWWGHSNARSYTMGWGYLCVFMKASHVQVVGTLRCNFLHHGGGGMPKASCMQVVGTLRHKVLPSINVRPSIYMRPSIYVRPSIYPRPSVYTRPSVNMRPCVNSGNEPPGETFTT